MQNYLYHLSQDPDYWAKCTTAAAPHAINNPWNGSGSDPRTWTSLPGSSARYTIELLPANGAAACSTADRRGDDDRHRHRDVQDPRHRPGPRRRRQALDRRDAQAPEPARLPVLHRQGDAGARTSTRCSRPARSEDGTEPAARPAGWAAANCDRYWGDDPSLGNRNAPTFSGSCSSPTAARRAHEPSRRAARSWASAPTRSSPDRCTRTTRSSTTARRRSSADSPDDAIETSSLGEPAVTSRTRRTASTTVRRSRHAGEPLDGRRRPTRTTGRPGRARRRCSCR